MQSSFEFLESHFPKIAGCGKRAEEALNSDYNICLFYLGKTAEKITDILRRSNNIDEKITYEEALSELQELKVIDTDINRKIQTLIENKEEKLTEASCSRLLTAAKELCEWFMLNYGESKFSFLGDLFLPGRFIPPLSNLAEIGREAEENLYSNTRYCLICLGDIGEAIVDYLISTNSIETHEREQLYRIDSLFRAYIITDEIRDALHDLRMARNKAVHERYDNNFTSEEEGKRLAGEVLKLCEWLFRLVMKPGCIVKGRIAEINEDDISVLIGNIPAVVPLSEVPSNSDSDSENSYIKGKKYIFKVIEKKGEKITLSLRQADEDYNLSMTQQYSKYKIGQDLRVLIKRISNSSGALVELKDGLEAQIPYSEIGRRLYDYNEANEKQIKYEVTARVKWFSLTQYPPMLLSIKDIENEHKNEPEHSNAKKWEKSAVTSKKKTIKDIDFRTLCKSASFEKIIEALDGGANPNAKNNNRNTALMTAAQYNHDPKVIQALLDAGADIEARNNKGNTALHFAAMDNTPEIIKILLDKGADIEALNHEKKYPLDYAKSNKNLNASDVLNLLTPKSEKSESEKKLEHKTESSQAVNINARLLELSQNGNPEQIAEIIKAGADVNTASHNHTTPLMTAAQYNKLEAVKILLENNADVNAQNKAGNTALMIAAQYNTAETIQALLDHEADVNAKNKMGNTALHIAAGFNTPEAVECIIKAGAILDAKNSKGKTPLDIAKVKTKLKGSEAVRLLLKPVLKKEFLRICRSGTEEEISDAHQSGANVNSKNKSLSTALMFAARDNTAQAVSILVDAGAYINAQDIYGNTALIYAASNNNDDVVDVLIEAGADISLTNISGFSAFNYAKGNYRLTDTEAIKKLNFNS